MLKPSKIHKIILKNTHTHTHKESAPSFKDLPPTPLTSLSIAYVSSFFKDHTCSSVLNRSFGSTKKHYPEKCITESVLGKEEKIILNKSRCKKDVMWSTAEPERIFARIEFDPKKKKSSLLVKDQIRNNKI